MKSVSALVTAVNAGESAMKSVDVCTEVTAVNAGVLCSRV